MRSYLLGSSLFPSSNLAEYILRLRQIHFEIKTNTFQNWDKYAYIGRHANWFAGVKFFFHSSNLTAITKWTYMYMMLQKKVPHCFGIWHFSWFHPDTLIILIQHRMRFERLFLWGIEEANIAHIHFSFRKSPTSCINCKTLILIFVQYLLNML